MTLDLAGIEDYKRQLQRRPRKPRSRYLRHCCGKAFRDPHVYMVHRRWYCTRVGWTPKKGERMVEKVLR